MIVAASVYGTPKFRERFAAIAVDEFQSNSKLGHHKKKEKTKEKTNCCKKIRAAILLHESTLCCCYISVFNFLDCDYLTPEFREREDHKKLKIKIRL